MLVTLRRIWSTIAGERLRYSAAIAALVVASCFLYLAPMIPQAVLDGVLAPSAAESSLATRLWVQALGGREFLAQNLWVAGLLFVALTAAAGRLHLPAHAPGRRRQRVDRAPRARRGLRPPPAPALRLARWARDRRLDPALHLGRGDPAQVPQQPGGRDRSRHGDAPDSDPADARDRSAHDGGLAAADPAGGRLLVLLLQEDQGRLHGRRRGRGRDDHAHSREPHRDPRGPRLRASRPRARALPRA